MKKLLEISLILSVLTCIFFYFLSMQELSILYFAICLLTLGLSIYMLQLINKYNKIDRERKYRKLFYDRLKS